MKNIELTELDVQDLSIEAMTEQSGGVLPLLAALAMPVVTVGIVTFGTLAIIGINYAYEAAKGSSKKT